MGNKKSGSYRDVAVVKRWSAVEFSLYYIEIATFDFASANFWYPSKQMSDQMLQFRVCLHSAFSPLTHCRLNELPPHYILEDSNFDLRYIRLSDLDIPREKWLNYLQTVETLMRCHVTLLGIFRLQWVKTTNY